MKNQKLLSGVLLTAFLLPLSLFAQNNWAENDDMFFSKKDREELYASAAIAEQSEYTANDNLNSPTTQSDIGVNNNQYFITNFSLKNKAYNAVKTNSRINTNTGFQSSTNAAPNFGSMYYNSERCRAIDIQRDSTNTYFGLLYPYLTSINRGRYSSYNPWTYNYNNGYNRESNNSYYGNNIYVTTSYSTNVDSESLHKKGGEIIGGRNSRPNTILAKTDKAIKNGGSSVNSNKKNSSIISRSSYRRQPNNAQNRFEEKAKRGNAHNRTKNDWNNTTNFIKQSNYRSSTSSPYSRSSSYNRPRVVGNSSNRSSSEGLKSGGKIKY